MNKNSNDVIVDPFKVYLRIRPFIERELNGDQNRSALTVENNLVSVTNTEGFETCDKKERRFAFDNIFNDNDSNKIVFDKIIKNLVKNIISGYNSTALAYGVTGTGKTHTMFGDIYQNLNLEKGICMLAVDYLFEEIKRDQDKIYEIKFNYLEIYNEQVIDLLSEKFSTNSTTEQNLMIVEDPTKGTSVPDLKEFIVNSSEEISNLIFLGNSRRTMASTSINQFSSRSHAIMQINLEQKSKKISEVIFSKLILADLAGSERGFSEKGIRREEGSNINKSLLALGNCINILSDKTKKISFVPYRDSKLTRLLKDSLGGNISTVMIACISPSILSYDDTINTLKYASRARKIENKVTKNIKENENYTMPFKEIIEKLKNEISHLKEIINNQNILLRHRLRDSFREDREFIKLNLNLNLNINSSGVDNFNNNNSLTCLNKYIASPKFRENIVSSNINTDHNFFDMEQTNNFIRDNKQLISKPIYPFKKELNFLDYEEILNANLNNFSDVEFDNYEKKLEM